MPSPCRRQPLRGRPGRDSGGLPRSGTGIRDSTCSSLYRSKTTVVSSRSSSRAPSHSAASAAGVREWQSAASRSSGSSCSSRAAIAVATGAASRPSRQLSTTLCSTVAPSSGDRHCSWTRVCSACSSSACLAGCCSRLPTLASTSQCARKSSVISAGFGGSLPSAKECGSWWVAGCLGVGAVRQQISHQVVASERQRGEQQQLLPPDRLSAGRPTVV